MFGTKAAIKKGSSDMFWLQTVILSLALVLILVGIWHEEKLIAFEDKIIDRFAYLVAQVIVRHRKRKAKKLHAQRVARANEIARARRSSLHVVPSQPQRRRTSNRQYIA